MNIFDDVKYVIEYSQEIENPRTDLLEEDFYEAKSKFIEMFGGLTYTYPEKVTFELSEKVKQERYKSFLSYVAENYRDRDLYSFIKHCGEKNFYENIYGEDIKEVPLTAGQYIHLVLQFDQCVNKIFEKKLFSSQKSLLLPSLLKRYSSFTSCLLGKFLVLKANNST